ncbi:MAG: hypothetical protein Q7R89_01675 [bacterium]|nr:hypothetical protein [bacterium]
MSEKVQPTEENINKMETSYTLALQKEMSDKREQTEIEQLHYKEYELEIDFSRFMQGGGKAAYNNRSEVIDFRFKSDQRVSTIKDINSGEIIPNPLPRDVREQQMKDVGILVHFNESTVEYSLIDWVDFLSDPREAEILRRTRTINIVKLGAASRLEYLKYHDKFIVEAQKKYYEQAMSEEDKFVKDNAAPPPKREEIINRDKAALKRNTSKAKANYEAALDLYKKKQED